MKKKTLRGLMSAGCAGAMLLNSVMAAAQGTVTATRKNDPQRVTVTTSDGGASGQAVFVTQDGVRTELPVGTDFTFIQDGAVGAGVGGTYSFAASEMSFDAKTVKGAPYSAEAVTEVIQTLPDGNRIVRRTSTQLYRDSEGRTRREQSVNPVGPWTTAEQNAQRIYINDPVGNANYILDPQSQTARRMPVFMRSTSVATFQGNSAAPASGAVAAAGSTNGIRVSGGVLQGSAAHRIHPQYPAVAKAAGAEGPVQVQITVNEEGAVTAAEAISGHPLLRSAAVDAARLWTFKPVELGGKAVKAQGLLTFNFALEKSANASSQPGQATQSHQTNQAGDHFTIERKAVEAAGVPVLVQSGNIRVKMESRREALGKQVVEGVEADGTRTVTTIPAGAVGNERPIEIVSERWYSPELQTVVMSRHYDPRSGETVYRLTNLVRSEPAAHLFQVPTDYTVKDDAQTLNLRRKVEELRQNQQ